MSPCFTPGVMIATDRGWRAVETLARGDRVVTRDNGLKRIAWVGRRDVDYGELKVSPLLKPILIRRGALGADYPVRETLVSPQHRFLAIGPAGTRGESLVSARDLLDRRGVARARVLGVSYLHLLCEAHEVILANGAWTESFHPDDMVMRGLAHHQRREILSLFPEIATMGAAQRFPSARPLGKSRFDG